MTFLGLWIFPLKTTENFLKFQMVIEKQLDKKIKTIQSDWGGEFRSLTSILNEKGINFRHYCPYIHQQNGRVERKHRHLVETGLTLLSHAHLPLSFWWLAIQATAFLIN